MTHCKACHFWEQFAGTPAVGHCSINRLTTLDLAACSLFDDSPIVTASLNEPAPAADTPSTQPDKPKRRKATKASA